MAGLFLFISRCSMRCNVSYCVAVATLFGGYAVYASSGQGSMPEATGVRLAGGLHGKRMPRVGFGTCCRASSKGQPLIDSTLEYLRQGGRLIDTAQMYDNHVDLAVAIQQSGVPQEPEIRHTTPSQLVDHEQRAKFSRHITRAIKRG